MCAMSFGYRFYDEVMRLEAARRRQRSDHVSHREIDVIRRNGSSADATRDAVA